MSWLSKIFGRRADAPVPPPTPTIASVVPARTGRRADAPVPPPTPTPAPVSPPPPPPPAAPSVQQVWDAPEPPHVPEPLPVPEPPSAVESARAEESPLAVEAPPAPEAPQPVHGEQEPDPMARFVAHQAQMQELHERAISAKQGQRWNDMVSAAETLQASATQANDRQSELQASRLLATAHANLRNYPMVFHCSSQAVVLARELHDADLPTDEHRLRTFVTALRPHLIDSGDADTVQALTAAEALIDAG